MDMDRFFGKREAEYFWEGGLDRANHVEPAQQISFCAQGLFDENLSSRRPMDVGIEPVGQITRAASC
jgi:hypothetical protein